MGESGLILMVKTSRASPPLQVTRTLTTRQSCSLWMREGPGTHEARGLLQAWDGGSAHTSSSSRIPMLWEASEGPAMGLLHMGQTQRTSSHFTRHLR